MARRDAERNHAKLVAAGREVFAEQGADASLEEVARRAGVGIGTLYRHFPTREALVEVIFEEHISLLVVAAEEAAAAEDAWSGLAGFLERALELQAQNLPLRGILLRREGKGRVPDHRRRLRPLLERLVARAREEGTLRADFALSDLSFAIWSFAPLLETTCGIAPGVWRRHLRILLDGMRAESATPQRVRPLTRRQHEAALEAFRDGHSHRRKAAA